MFWWIRVLTALKSRKILSDPERTSVIESVETDKVKLRQALIVRGQDQENFVQLSPGTGSGGGAISSSKIDAVTSSKVLTDKRRAVGTKAHTKSSGSPIR